MTRVRGTLHSACMDPGADWPCDTSDAESTPSAAALLQPLTEDAATRLDSLARLHADMAEDAAAAVPAPTDLPALQPTTADASAPEQPTADADAPVKTEPEPFEAERRREVAKREAARAAARANGTRAARERLRLAQEYAAAQAELAAEKESVIVKLWQRYKRQVEAAGVDENLRAGGAVPLAADVAAASKRLRGIMFEARRLGASECERMAFDAYGRALRKTAALERSEALESQWHQREAADATADLDGCNLQSNDKMRADAAKAVQAAERLEAQSQQVQPNEPCKLLVPSPAPVAPAIARAVQTSDIPRPVSAVETGGGRSCEASGRAGKAWAAAAAAVRSEAASKLERRKKPAFSMLVPSLLGQEYHEAVRSMPPVIPTPLPTLEAMRSSLTPVLAALNGGVGPRDRREYEAAKAAYASWHQSASHGGSNPLGSLAA